jgi:hypothetical protein
LQTYRYIQICWYTHKRVLEHARTTYFHFHCDYSVRHGGNHSPSRAPTYKCSSFAFLAHIIPISYWKRSHYAYFTFSKCARRIHRITGSCNHFVLACDAKSKKPTPVLKRYTHFGWNFFL